MHKITPVISHKDACISPMDMEPTELLRVVKQGSLRKRTSAIPLKYFECNELSNNYQFNDNKKAHISLQSQLKSLIHKKNNSLSNPFTKMENLNAAHNKLIEKSQFSRNLQVYITDTIKKISKKTLSYQLKQTLLVPNDQIRSLLYSTTLDCKCLGHSTHNSHHSKQSFNSKQCIEANLSNKQNKYNTIDCSGRHYTAEQLNSTVRKLPQINTKLEEFKANINRMHAYKRRIINEGNKSSQYISKTILPLIMLTTKKKSIKSVSQQITIDILKKHKFTKHYCKCPLGISQH
jgi:hypothetical protein